MYSEASTDRCLEIFFCTQYASREIPNCILNSVKKRLKTQKELVAVRNIRQRSNCWLDIVENGSQFSSP